MAKTNTTTALEERAKNYAKEVTSIEDFVQKVRQTPDVYIGKVAGNVAFLTMTREIFQNAIDEILKGVSFSPNVIITYDERDHSITVEDNGRGIPHGMIGKIFGSDHTSSNYTKKPYEYSAGKNGCGGSTTNALSHKFTVTSYVVGKGKYAEFHEGHLWNKGEIDVPCDGRQGSIVSFIPNEDVIGQVTASWTEVYHLISTIVPSAPIGTTAEFIGIDIAGKKHVESIVNQDGILTYLINMTQNPYINPICVSADNGQMKVNVAFTYDTSPDSVEHIISLNNTCPTDGGTHVEGALDGIVKWFRNYMNKIYLANVKSKNKLVATAQDIRVGLKLAVSTFHLYAIYNGQAKEILDNEDMIPFVSTTVQEGLNEWAKVNPNDLQKICKWIKEMIDLRLSTDNKKVKLSKNFQTSAFSNGLPAKYIKPNGTKNTELIIVEGDSAYGSARNSRNHETQGIYPIRGKMPNVFVKSKAEIMKNAECTGILNILDAGWGDNFDLSKCKVDRVIIMADADADGAHIRTLVLRFLSLYCRPLVEAGRVFAALPPLYGIPGRNGKWTFFANKLEFIKYVQNQFAAKFELTDSKGIKLSNKEVLSLLYRNEGYVNALEHVSTNYAISPKLLELLCYYRHLDSKKLISLIKKHYRFMDGTVIAKSNTIIFKGLADDKEHEVFFNDYLLSECADILQYTDNSQLMYKLNGVDVTLYQVMKQFNGFVPTTLSRFKGLGEMDPEMLGISTLNAENRTLIRYKFDDISREIEQMRYINSNKDLLLKDIDFEEDM